METLFLTLDTVALIVMLYFSYKGGKSAADPEQGPFRLRKLPVARPPLEGAPAERNARTVRRR